MVAANMSGTEKLPRGLRNMKNLPAQKRIKRLG